MELRQARILGVCTVRAMNGVIVHTNVTTVSWWLAVDLRQTKIM